MARLAAAWSATTMMKIAHQPNERRRRCTLLVTLAAACVLSPGFLLAASTKTPLGVSGLRTEYKENPLGIDAHKPRLSWVLVSSGRGVQQSAYELRVARTEAAVRSGRDLVWTSGRVASPESTQRAYEGPALQSGARYHWQVRAWDGAGAASAWSVPAWWETGLLEPSDWKANWIEPDLPEDVKTSGPAPMLRRAFKLSGAIARARA
jgi:alpha-L-rhamnosidase